MTEQAKKAAGEFVDGLLGGTQQETDMKNAKEEKSDEGIEKTESNVLNTLNEKAENITIDRPEDMNQEIQKTFVNKDR